MGVRFYRRIGLIPGLRVNLSRSGPSLSIGHRGAWYTIGPRGPARDASEWFISALWLRKGLSAGLRARGAWR
jgi:hypothetical protein